MAKFVLALVALLGVSLLVGSFVVDQRAAAEIEELTSHALGVPASLEGARLSLFTGGIGLGRLDVANAEGFPSERFMRIGTSEGRVRLLSFFRDVVELPELELRDIEVHLERRDGVGNYESILAHYHEVGRAPPVDEPRRYLVEELVLRDIVVRLDLLPAVGEAARLDVAIDSVRLSGLGANAERGLPLTQIAGVVTQALLAAVLERAAAELPPAVARELTRRLGIQEEVEALGDLLRRLTVPSPPERDEIEPRE